ncbi:hypothetical protein NLG97_g1099 [Lecanicillium saksenae]|uniref:Uncharacterized protein n=1 Tax=Lecanicillium saksenae TaxID=468837 RepID=A0ACC1R4P2_9HYPO|nr:hypothetical protein NLG97_g1099 [Lecanicillium saksenae]
MSDSCERFKAGHELFRQILENFAKTSKFRENAPNIFMIYAHKNRDLSDLEALPKIAVKLAAWLRFLYVPIQYDKRPKLLFSKFNKSEDGALHDLAANQFRLLPGHSGTAQKVILCASKLLSHYVDKFPMEKIVHPMEKLVDDIEGVKQNDNSSDRYNVANLVYFVPYILVQPTTPYLTQKMTPRIFISTLAVGWGVVTMCMGFSNSYHTLTALRAMLDELGKKSAIFFLAAFTGAGFNGILSYGLVQLDGVANMKGWRWLFIMEGLLTITVGIISYIVLPNFLTSSGSFLGDDEKRWISERLREDCGEDKQVPFDLGEFLKGGLDWRIWAYAYVFFSATLIAFGLIYSLPLILRDSMGFSFELSQILVSPPYLFSAIVMFINGYVGDRFRIRGPLILNLAVISIIGVAVTGWTSSAGARYFGVFLLASGGQGIIPVTVALQANNLRGHWRKGFAPMLFTATGGIGGMAGSLVFRLKDKATGYKPGLYTCFAAAAPAIIVVLIWECWIYSKNQQADRDGILLEADEEEGVEDFRYTY